MCDGAWSALYIVLRKSTHTTHHGSHRFARRPLYNGEWTLGAAALPQSHGLSSLTLGVSRGDSACAWGG